MAVDASAQAVGTASSGRPSTSSSPFRAVSSPCRMRDEQHRSRPKDVDPGALDVGPRSRLEQVDAVRDHAVASAPSPSRSQRRPGLQPVSEKTPNTAESRGRLRAGTPGSWQRPSGAFGPTENVLDENGRADCAGRQRGGHAVQPEWACDRAGPRLEQEHDSDVQQDEGDESGIRQERIRLGPEDRVPELAEAHETSERDGRPRRALLLDQIDVRARGHACEDDEPVVDPGVEEPGPASSPPARRG